MKDAVIDNIIRCQAVEDYLDYFENKDFESIASLFSEDCVLIDWNVGTVSSKEEVMKVFASIFSSIANIEINIHNIHEDFSGTLICEMTLIADGEKLLVADIFEFDDNDQIRSLRAYRGN